MTTKIIRLFSKMEGWDGNKKTLRNVPKGFYCVSTEGLGQVFTPRSSLLSS